MIGCTESSDDAAPDQEAAAGLTESANGAGLTDPLDSELAAAARVSICLLPRRAGRWLAGWLAGAAAGCTFFSPYLRIQCDSWVTKQEATGRLIDGR